MKTRLNGLSFAASVAMASACWAPLALAERPTIIPDATVTKECGSCHMAFPAEMLPARSWTALMEGLSSHFGENAALDAAKRKEILDWLTAHAGELARFQRSLSARPRKKRNASENHRNALLGPRTQERGEGVLTTPIPRSRARRIAWPATRTPPRAPSRATTIDLSAVAPRGSATLGEPALSHRSIEGPRHHRCPAWALASAFPVGSACPIIRIISGRAILIRRSTSSTALWTAATLWSAAKWQW